MANMRAKVVFDRAFVQFHKNDYLTAIELFKEAIMEEPHYPEALYNLACCYSIVGQNEDALVYLDRAIKLDVSCLDWAKEDVEFDPIRSDPEFAKVLARNDPVKKRKMGEDAKLDDEGENGKFGGKEFLDAAGAFGGAAPGAGGPSCKQCGAYVMEEYRPYVNKYLAMGLALSGIIILFALFDTLLGVGFGLPMIGIGLFLFKKKRWIFVCQNCGAAGRAAVANAGKEEEELEAAEPVLAQGTAQFGDAEPLMDESGVETLEDAIDEAMEDMGAPLTNEEVTSKE